MELIERLRDAAADAAAEGYGVSGLLAEAAAEIEALRAEAIRTESELHQRIEIAEARAEWLAGALRDMVENACAACDVLPNGTHRIDATEQEWAAHVAATDKAIAALHPTAAQEGK